VTEILPAPAGGLIAAIAAVMADIDTVAKRGVNQFHDYNYARMGDILEKVTPLLGKHGIVVFQTETGRAMFDGDSVIAVEYAFTVVHVSGERWEPIKQSGASRCRDSKGGWDDKSLAKCHTAARKYFLLSLFQIPTGDEADADAGELDHVQRRRTPAPRQAQRCDVPPAAVPALRPRTVVEPPKRRLERDRTIDARYENVIRYDQARPKPTRMCEAEMVRRETLPPGPFKPSSFLDGPPPCTDASEFDWRRK
jgi:hypothetical protein